MEEKASRDFPGGPVADSALPLLGAQLRSLVWELRSRMLHGKAKTPFRWVWRWAGPQGCMLCFDWGVPVGMLWGTVCEQ